MLTGSALENVIKRNRRKDMVMRLLDRVVRHHWTAAYGYMDDDVDLVICRLCGVVLSGEHPF